MKAQTVSLTLFLMLFFISCTAQNILVLEKANKRKLFQFKEGDRIRVYAEPDSVFAAGRIAYLTDSSIYFENSGYEIAISHIREAYTTRWGMRFLSELFLKGGIGYALVGGINQAISGRQPDLFRYPIIVGGGLIIASFALRPLVTRKHKLYDHSWRMIILDFRGMPPQYNQ